jgi:hypothetical protein
MWRLNNSREYNELRDRVDAMAHAMSRMESAMSALQASSTVSTPSMLSSRIEDLEMWRAKVHDLLVGKTPGGRPSLSSLGRSIRERYRG